MNDNEMLNLKSNSLPRARNWEFASEAFSRLHSAVFLNAICVAGSFFFHLGRARKKLFIDWHKNSFSEPHAFRFINGEL